MAGGSSWVLDHVSCGLRGWTFLKYSIFELNFWSLQTWKPPGLMAILVPDSNIRAGESPSYHNHQRQVGVRGFWTMYNLWFEGLDLPEVLDLS